MRPCWKPSPVHSAVTKGRVELPRLLGLDVLSVACLPVPPLGQVARVGIEPTDHHQGLSLAALPVCVPCQASSMGFEPMTSTVTGRRALLTAPRGQFRGLESNQHQRVQSPMSYRLDDPGINKRLETMRRPTFTYPAKGTSAFCCSLAHQPPFTNHCPVRTVGFEPTLSGSRNRRISRLSYVLIDSTQRESNPHILHGEQVGCRYITGASGTRGT